MIRSQKSGLRFAQSVACAAPNAISKPMTNAQAMMNTQPAQSRMGAIVGPSCSCLQGRVSR